MAPLSPEQALERAKAAAETARQAADAAQGYADQVAAFASAATHGTVDPLIFQLAIFVLAVFVGYHVVWSVTPALHTPLMSVTNAISSVIVVGAVLAAGVGIGAGMGGGMGAGMGGTLFDDGPLWARAMGFIALILASINIFGGFLVTQRMLAMYRKKD
jgi:H+-translocating NAD(P) transhydrogenase subunit alpha